MLCKLKDPLCLCLTVYCGGKGVGGKPSSERQVKQSEQVSLLGTFITGQCAMGVLTDQVENYPVICNISQAYLKGGFFFFIECPY